jgi:hypothetical protein
LAQPSHFMEGTFKVRLIECNFLIFRLVFVSMFNPHRS